MTNNCGEQIDCGKCPAQVCQDVTCASNTCDYADSANDVPGTDCATRCCAGVCCDAGEICDERDAPAACCQPDADEETCAGGACGTVRNNCGQVVDCGDCAEIVCQASVCGNQNTCEYAVLSDLTACADGGVSGICCTARCVAAPDSGACCVKADCAARTCHSVGCSGDHACEYSELSGDACDLADGQGVCCSGQCQECCGDDTRTCKAAADCFDLTCESGSCVYTATSGDVCALTDVVNGVCCSGVCQSCCGSDTSTCAAPLPCTVGGCAGGLCTYTDISGGTCALEDDSTGACCSGACRECCGTDTSTCAAPDDCYEVSCDGGGCKYTATSGGACALKDDTTGVCCAGRCLDCCGDGDCANPTPICLDNACTACTTDAECGDDAVCCDGSCFAGDCCDNGGCANPTPICTSHTCTVCTDADNCGGGRVCCAGSCQECCDDDASTCQHDNECETVSCSAGACLYGGIIGGTCELKAGGTGTCCSGVCRECCEGDASACAALTCQSAACSSGECVYSGVTGGACAMGDSSTGMCCAGACQECCGSDASTCDAPLACQLVSCSSGACAYASAGNGSVGADCSSANDVCYNGACCTPEAHGNDLLRQVRHGGQQLRAVRELRRLLRCLRLPDSHLCGNHLYVWHGDERHRSQQCLLGQPGLRQRRLRLHGCRGPLQLGTALLQQPVQDGNLLHGRRLCGADVQERELHEQPVHLQQYHQRHRPQERMHGFRRTGLC